MTLRELTAPLDRPLIAGDGGVSITGLAYDSRKVKPGACFVALRGSKVDGHDYIEKAIAAGAAAIVAETPPPENITTPWVHMYDTRVALASLSAVFYGRPADELAIAGITGTNGKTTIAFLIHHLANQALMRCGLMGTVVYDLGGQLQPATHTTPESLEIHEHLREMRNHGCRALAMEVSSHALHQHRVHGLKFAAAVFTNLTQDHLDYHGTFENYFDAKAMLFEAVAAQSNGQMIINADDLWGRKLALRFESTGRTCKYGLSVGCDFRAANIRYDLTGTSFELEAKGRQYLVRTPLIGDFNVYNTLAALAAADALKLNFREAVNHMKLAPQVPGRLERVSEDTNKFHVFVDYAHTPDALVNVLKTLRVLRPNRIITVFGCGGDRDRVKRPLMARAAEQGSDICILTSDNPRMEDPKQIIADARKGFTGKNFGEIEDRAQAIRTAISNASPGDIVLVAGKGHEDYQDIKGVKHPFDDRKVAKVAINSRREMAGLRRLENQREQTERESRHRADDDYDPNVRRWNQ